MSDIGYHVSYSSRRETRARRERPSMRVKGKPKGEGGNTENKTKRNKTSGKPAHILHITLY